MSAQAQMEEIRRLSGEHPPAPPPPEPEPPVSKRVALAMLLAALVGVGLLHAVLVKRFAARTGARAQRAAMIVARAAADVATAYGGEGDSFRSAMAAWQKAHPNVSSVRVVNIDSRSRGDEVTVSRRDGEILIAAPVEKDGSVIGFAQVRTRPEIVAVEAPSVWFALAFALAPFVVVLALSFVMRKNAQLVLIACGLLFVTLFAYRQWAMGSLETGARVAEQRFAERVMHEAGIVARIAPGVERKAATWDADTRRVPLRIDPARAVEGEKSAVANAGYVIGVLSLALLLLVGAARVPRSILLRVRSLVALALLSTLGATPAAADCHDAAGNLLAAINCGFDKDTKGWTPSPGAGVSREPADGGVLKGVADSQGSLTILGPCVAAQPNVEYQIGARLRGIAGTSYFCSVNVFQYSDAHCTEGQDPLGSAAAPPETEWVKLDGSATTSDAAKSLQLRPACSGTAGFIVQFDDFVVSKK